MNAVKTFRDELAVSLPDNLMPEIKTEEALIQVAEKLNINLTGNKLIDIYNRLLDANRFI